MPQEGRTRQGGTGGLPGAGFVLWGGWSAAELYKEGTWLLAAPQAGELLRAVRPAGGSHTLPNSFGEPIREENLLLVGAELAGNRVRRNGVQNCDGTNSTAV